MPNVIKEKISPKGQTQSVNAALREANQLLRGAPSGQIITATLGEDVRVQSVSPSQMSASEIEEAKVLRQFLKEVVTPPELGSKSNPNRDRRSMHRKLDMRDIDQLHLLVPEEYRSMQVSELTDSDKARIDQIYRDISP